MRASEGLAFAVLTIGFMYAVSIAYGDVLFAVGIFAALFAVLVSRRDESGKTR